MEKEIDVSGTAAAIEAAADRLRMCAKELDGIASRMTSNNDISYAGEALMVLINVLQQCRPDLFITRPLRALVK